VVLDAYLALVDAGGELTFPTAATSPPTCAK
jgi:hypothetical protein